MPTVITAESPDTADATFLIDELDAYLSSLYSIESRHGLSVEELIAQGVAFLVTRYDDKPSGCGGVKLFGVEFGEIKRMYVCPQFRGQGLAKLMLNHFVAFARERGIRVLRLETGIHPVEAIGL